jgi:arylsulfatase A-like enzyme
MKRKSIHSGVSLLAAALIAAGWSTQAADPEPTPAAAGQPAKKPNILFIMGDDIGWFNIGAYHQGIMSGKTPNLDRLAREGVRFTDYYAEASCTAGRANFITAEIPLRTGLTTVGRCRRRHPDAGVHTRDRV